MAKQSRNFIKGKMNKGFDERIVPDGEYIDALNVFTGSTEQTEMGALENAKGNTKLTTLQFAGTPLSVNAICIGAHQESDIDTIFWFVHDPNWGLTNKLDLVVSYNASTGVTTYHVVSVSVLNFNPSYLITGVDVVDNLLFWTDDYNNPRCINIKRSYSLPVGPITYTDTIVEDDLAVIKKPPFTSPAIRLITSGPESGFMRDRFLCFAYRYRYADGEYSATSQFSEPAFLPGAFNITSETGLNDGMLNQAKSCEITYNSGDRLVTGIDLLVKDMDTGSIRVIKKIDKADLGLSNNVNYTYIYSNNKNVTVLPNQEILRLYDNVPRLAKAQTIMGNRLIYGNYVEGYDLEDSTGYALRNEYQAELISEDIGESSISSSYSNATYNIDGAITITDGITTFDLTGLDLVSGVSITFEILLNHDSFTTSGIPDPTQTNTDIIFTFTFTLSKNYNSVYELATSQEFNDVIGTISNIQTVPNACNGFTETDEFNCDVEFSLNALNKVSSGINFSGEPILILSSPTANTIGFQFPAIRYEDPVTPADYAYEYLAPSNSIGSYRRVSSITSLHSNTGYEVGIVYMDNYARSSTVLTSEDNNVYVPSSGSSKSNRIRVTIPPQQKPPYWATRYKFAIKPDKDQYDTIYSSTYFVDDETGSVWFLLEGENIRKIEEGDKLVVKADSSGPLNRYVETVVLSKGSKEKDFISVRDDVGNEISVPSGVYMELDPSEFSVSSNVNSTISYGTESETVTGNLNYPVVTYPVQVKDPASTTYTDPWIDYELNVGSKVRIYLDVNRDGRDQCVWNCNPKWFIVNLEFDVTSNFVDFKSWWDANNIAAILNNESSKFAGCGGTELSIDYDPTLIDMAALGSGCAALNTVVPQGDDNNIYIRFVYDNDCATTPDKKYLVVTGPVSCYRNFESSIKLSITVDTEGSTAVIFETKAKEALPDIWYESSDTYLITGGNHQGNVQNQNISLGVPAIVDTPFFNCYSFGNGAESYKIQDSIVGRSISLGNRVLGSSVQEYREIRRFADLTYSGVYNDETNVNKFNEFNKGLLNYKALEDSFGSVQLIDGRETDILVLQTDKISYVLAGKNLLSDSAGGGVISSVPEVLGTQIARQEEFGISFNPESYAKWGYEKYFTDAKRGVVIQLIGSSAGNEKLVVVSDIGMQPWFRDMFIASQNTQKLGGIDPYMGSYVLSNNDTLIPIELECQDCGGLSTVNVTSSDPYSFCVDAGELVGDVTVSYRVISSSSNIKITATYDSTPYTTGFTAAPTGNLNVPKNKVGVSNIDILMEVFSGSAQIEISVSCPAAQQINIILVTLSNVATAGQVIHNEYRWTDGVFVSPLHSNQITMATGLGSYIVSQFDLFTAPQGGGYVPADGAAVTMISRRVTADGDDLIFDVSKDSFRYLRTNVIYSNNPAGIAALLAASSAVTPITSADPSYSAQFTMPSTNDPVLYLIYDYVREYQEEFCYSNVDEDDACFGCIGSELIEVTQCREDGVINTEIVPRAFGVTLGDFVTLNLYDPNCVFEVTTLDASGIISDTIAGVSYVESCDDVCGYYDVSNSTGGTLNIGVLLCDNSIVTVPILASTTQSLCIKKVNFIDPGLTITLTSCTCP